MDSTGTQVSVFYLDASAWVKRYLREPGSDRVTELFLGPERLAGIGLGYVDVAAIKPAAGSAEA